MFALAQAALAAVARVAHVMAEVKARSANVQPTRDRDEAGDADDSNCVGVGCSKRESAELLEVFASKVTASLDRIKADKARGVGDIVTGWLMQFPLALNGVRR